METTKKKRGGERLKIEAAGRGGGIIVIGGALVAAAVGAAFAAHRARGRARGNINRGAVDENKEEEKGLQSLLPSVEEQEAGVPSAAGQENASEKSEIGETTEGKESERTGALVGINELKKASEMTENFEDEVREAQTKGNGNMDHSEEEYAFDSSVEIQETGEIHGSYKIPEMITEIKGSEIEASINKIGPINGDDAFEEFSLWNGKSSTPEIQSERSLTELETTHLPQEQEKFCNEEDGEKREEGSEVVEACFAELSEDATWPATPIEQEETSDIKQQLEIPEKTKDICGSEGGEQSKTLQDCIEQKQGQVFVDNSEEAQENACNDFKIVAGTFEIPHVEGEEEEEEGSSIKSQEEIELQLEDMGEREGEESEGSRNSSAEFSDQAVWPEDEQVKEDDSVSISEMKQQLKISRNIEEVNVSSCCTNYNNQVVREFVSDSVEINMPNDETSEKLEESEIIHVEVEEAADDEQEQERLPVEEESEREESIETGKFSIELEKCSVPTYEMKHQLKISRNIEEVNVSICCINDNNQLVKESISDSAEINMPNDETSENLEESEIIHVEVEEEADDEQEQEMLPVEEESEGEESIETGKFSIELEKCPVPTCEMKHQLKISRNIEEVDVSIRCTNYNNQLVQESVSDSVEINMPNDETSENLEESEIIHVEVEEEAEDEQEQERLPVEEESEGEESIEPGNFSIELEKCSVPMYEMKQGLESPEKIDEMVDEAHAEGTENTTGGIQSSLPSDDKHKQVSLDSSVEVLEKVFMNLDMETEIDLEHDVVNACSFTDVAFNSSQGQNQQDWEESEIAHVKEEEQQEETGLPSIENEMKLQFEMPQKTTDFRQAEQDEEEHEQQVPKKGSETIVTYKEKRMDFVLIGSSKLFLLVLITLAIGLLAFVHSDHLHHYSLCLPKIYRQLYQLFFPSYNGVLGEL